MPAPPLRLTLAYIGTRWAGWQRQENATTVQEVVEQALADLLGENVTVAGASRTDAGVHAQGQEAHFTAARELPLKALVHGTNHRLPEDVRVLAAHRMSEGFHARFSALAKEYVYRLVRADTLSPFVAPYAIPGRAAARLGGDEHGHRAPGRRARLQRLRARRRRAPPVATADVRGSLGGGRRRAPAAFAR